MKTKETTVDLSILRQALGVNLNTAAWKKVEYEEFLTGGGSLTKRGFVCTHCGFFRHKRQGPSKYCEDCGYKMEWLEREVDE